MTCRRCTRRISQQYCRGLWLIELGELAVTDKVENSHLKAFLSRQIERYRAPYGRLFSKEPRQACFAASTNKNQYLKDETGDRRYWPVEVFEFLAADELLADRPQIFAEAAHLYRSGVTWWPSREFQEEYAKPVQDSKFEVDVWEDAISKFIATVEKATVGQVGHHALQLELRRIGKREQIRITNCLEHLGWCRGRRGGPNGDRFWNARPQS